MSCLANDPYASDFTGAEQVDLPGLLRRSDVVSLHVPLTEGTRHLIDATALAAMRPGAVLINAARGGVVEDAALCAALRSGHLGGAALDTFETEPLGPDHPFADVPNLILTPHIGGVTREANARVSEMIARGVVAEIGL